MNLREKYSSVVTTGHYPGGCNVNQHMHMPTKFPSFIHSFGALCSGPQHMGQLTGSGALTLWTRQFLNWVSFHLPTMSGSDSIDHRSHVITNLLIVFILGNHL